MPAKVYHDDLLRYIYNETTEVENVLIESILFESPELENAFFELLALKQQLDSVEYSPREKTVQSILGASEAITNESIA